MTKLQQYKQIEKSRNELLKDTKNITFKERMKIKREYTQKLHTLLIEEKTNNKNICQTLDKLFNELVDQYSSYNVSQETREALQKWSKTR